MATHCFNRDLNGTIQTTLSVIEDVLVLIIPIALVSRVRTNKVRKRFLIGILCLGVFAVAAGVTRAVMLMTFGKRLLEPETWVVLPLVTAVEINVAITATSLPALSPLLKYMAKNVLKTVARTSGSTMGRSKHHWNDHSAAGVGRMDRKGSILSRTVKKIGIRHNEGAESLHSTSTPDIPLRKTKPDQAHFDRSGPMGEAERPIEGNRQESLGVPALADAISDCNSVEWKRPVI